MKTKHGTHASALETEPMPLAKRKDIEKERPDPEDGGSV